MTEREAETRKLAEQAAQGYCGCDIGIDREGKVVHERSCGLSSRIERALQSAADAARREVLEEIQARLQNRAKLARATADFGKTHGQDVPNWKWNQDLGSAAAYEEALELVSALSSPSPTNAHKTKELK